MVIQIAILQRTWAAYLDRTDNSTIVENRTGVRQHLLTILSFFSVRDRERELTHRVHAPWNSSIPVFPSIMVPDRVPKFSIDYVPTGIVSKLVFQCHVLAKREHADPSDGMPLEN